jgi:hypothetical protein
MAMLISINPIVEGLNGTITHPVIPRLSLRHTKCDYLSTSPTQAAEL